MNWVAKLKSKIGTKQATAREQYREILKKGSAAELTAADQMKLEQIISELGITPEQLETDAAAIAAFIGLTAADTGEQIADQIAKKNDELQLVHAEYQEAIAKTTEPFQKKMTDIRSDITALEHKQRIATSEKSQREHIINNNPGLFE